MAAHAAENLLKNGDTLGLGSGSAVARFAKALGERVKKEALKISVIPSSMQSFLLASENGLEFSKDTAHCPETIDVAVDGADQISLPTRSMIKGGGGALLKEKIIIAASKKCYILGDDSKFVDALLRSVPVEVTQFSYLSTGSMIRRKYGAETVLRKLEKGYPYYTESGNVILDCQLKSAIADPKILEREIKSIPGVVECGIFNEKVEAFYRANRDGSFDSL